jgi:hypothetical protein
MRPFRPEFQNVKQVPNLRLARSSIPAERHSSAFNEAPISLAPTVHFFIERDKKEVFLFGGRDSLR